MIFRDDDINRFTDIQVFLEIHNLFIKYNKTHLCVCEMKDLWESRGLWHLLMTLPNIEIGLHCWEHIDYSVLTYEQAKENIQKCLDYFYSKRNGYTAKEIKIFCPPWNRVSLPLSKACFDLGLSVNDGNDGKTYNFHWWSALDKEFLSDLERRLRG
jgi:hypothetical protein